VQTAPQPRAENSGAPRGHWVGAISFPDVDHSATLQPSTRDPVRWRLKFRPGK
jgi:hypothetical protein